VAHDLRANLDQPTLIGMLAMTFVSIIDSLWEPTGFSVWVTNRFEPKLFLPAKDAINMEPSPWPGDKRDNERNIPARKNHICITAVNRVLHQDAPFIVNTKVMIFPNVGLNAGAISMAAIFIICPFDRYLWRNFQFTHPKSEADTFKWDYIGVRNCNGGSVCV
jgi:hypothetical protein